MIKQMLHPTVRNFKTPQDPSGHCIVNLVFSPPSSSPLGSFFLHPKLYVYPKYPTHWLTLLLVLGKNCVNQILCYASNVKLVITTCSEMHVIEGTSAS